MDLIQGFKKRDLSLFNENVFDMLDKEWMLVTAGVENDFNTMTASWGGFGVLWNKPVAIAFVRPQRHTHKFTETFDAFTLSFFGHGNFREALSFCGSKSGRDFDKPKETGLTPITTPIGAIAFQQARLIFECKKLYADDIKSDCFIDLSIDSKVYAAKDHHRFYIAEIFGCYEKLS
ncbi:MAG: flavin reductase [Bacteroidales bacterium]|jgi:flavin reductase (DIM6/NTAB) family NADH-FMN oxidoreductase RutF|nr:flavin reductase [Bacteroidales bacterium]MDD4385035.1 flavin reductase [Bacteroidales bacterium]MDY0196657.1 flavin reductase [Tenuifilaceae bacterium]